MLLVSGTRPLMPATGVRIPQRGQPHSQSSLRNAQLRVDISGAIVAPTAANDGAALRLVTRMQSSLLSGTIVQHHPGQRPPSQLRPMPSTLLGRKPAVPLVIAPFSEERLRELIPSPTVGTVAELAPIAHPLHSSSSGPLFPAAHRQQLNSMPTQRPSPAADHDPAVRRLHVGRGHSAAVRASRTPEARLAEISSLQINMSKSEPPVRPRGSGRLGGRLILPLRGNDPEDMTDASGPPRRRVRSTVVPPVTPSQLFPPGRQPPPKSPVTSSRSPEAEQPS